MRGTSDYIEAGMKCQMVNESNARAWAGMMKIVRVTCVFLRVTSACHSSAIRPFVRNPARDPNLARVQTQQVRKQDDRRPPPKFLTGFCSLPHFAPAICIPHFSLPSVRPSSLFPSALSNVRHTRERVSFANAFGDDGAEEEERCIPPVPPLQLRSARIV